MSAPSKDNRCSRTAAIRSYRPIQERHHGRWLPGRDSRGDHGADAHFSTFDRRAEHHGLEKAKTIGDAYVVVAGLPSHDPTLQLFAMPPSTAVDARRTVNL